MKQRTLSFDEFINEKRKRKDTLESKVPEDFLWELMNVALNADDFVEKIKKFFIKVFKIYSPDDIDLTKQWYEENKDNLKNL